MMNKFSIVVFLLMASLGVSAERAYLDNGQVRLGVDLERGGTICFLSTGAEAEKENMVNIHDLGRYIQQSYYAGEAVDRRDEGQHHAFSPWHWNPIQAGGIGCVAKPPHKNAKAEILEHKQDGDHMYIKCIPRLWDMPGEAAECVFEQWMWLEGSAVRVSNKVTIARTDNIWKEGVVRDQEIPAVYPIARLRDCYTYTGDSPWTVDAVVKMPDNPKGYKKNLPPTDPNGFPWNRFKPTEPWAACVNSDTGLGFGVYSPRADATWLSGFVNHLKRQNGRDDSMANSTSYISPLTQVALNKDSVFGYTYYLIPGSVEDVRRFVYEKENKPWPKRSAAQPKLNHQFEFINNGEVCVGVDMNAGGAIAFLSTGSEKERDNWVNIHDLGRYIQQCYYAGEEEDRRDEGQHKRFSPWKWNPIQAGSIGCTFHPPHPNAHSEILEFKKDKTSLYLKCVPRLWDMPGETPECFFEQWIRLEGDAVRVSNKVTVARTDDIWGEGKVREQELPSIYPIARLRDGYTYTNSAPWTSDAVVKMPDNPPGYDVNIPPTQPGGFPWNRFEASEHWMAYVHPETGIGFGVYNPTATARWVCGFFQGGGAKGDGPYSDSNCFIGPLRWMKLKKNDTFAYEYYLILGTVEDVRGFAYKKEGKTLTRK